MRQILVIQTASIGDVVLATALLEKLHLAYPGARLDFLVTKGMESLFQDHPFIRRLLLWDKSAKYRDFFRVAREVRRAGYDAVINVQRFALTGILTLFSGAGYTSGFDKNPFSRWFSRRIPHRIGPGIHETDRNQLLIAELTDETPAHPRLYPPSAPRHSLCERSEATPSDFRHPARSLRAKRSNGIYYTISPASLWFTKQFPASRWAELIRMVPVEATVYLLGSKNDFDLCEQIRLKSQGSRIQDNGKDDPASGIRNLAGTLTLLESAALMKGARMNFTNDSAPLHLASAVDAPVTVIYCSTTPGFGFGPLSGRSAVVEVREHLPCRPCGLHGRRSCPEAHFRCALSIDLNDLRSQL